MSILYCLSTDGSEKFASARLKISDRISPGIRANSELCPCGLGGTARSRLWSVVGLDAIFSVQVWGMGAELDCDVETDLYCWAELGD